MKEKPTKALRKLHHLCMFLNHAQNDAMSQVAASAIDIMQDMRL